MEIRGPLANLATPAILIAVVLIGSAIGGLWFYDGAPRMIVCPHCESFDLSVIPQTAGNDRHYYCRDCHAEMPF